MPTISDFISAITTQEGAHPALNNPGNLMNWSASLPTDYRGITIFPTLQDGLNALSTQIQKNINRGLTLAEFFGGKPGVYPGYAASSQSPSNNPTVYANNVAKKLGIDPNTKLSEVNWGDASSLPLGIDAVDTTDSTSTGMFDGSDPLVWGIVIAALGLVFFTTSRA